MRKVQHEIKITIDRGSFNDVTILKYSDYSRVDVMKLVEWIESGLQGLSYNIELCTYIDQDPNIKENNMVSNVWTAPADIVKRIVWRYNMIIIARIELNELPKDCSDCPLCYDDMYCTAVDMPKCKNIRYDGERPDWCPMIDVTYPVTVYMKRLAELFAKTVARLNEESHD